MKHTTRYYGAPYGITESERAFRGAVEWPEDRDIMRPRDGALLGA